MAKKPTFVNINQWKLMSADEREIIADVTDPKEFADWWANRDKAPATTDAPAADQKEHEPPKAVADWAKGIAAKIDDAFRKDIKAGIALKKQVTHKVLDYVGHIERLGLKLPRWDSIKPDGSNAPDTDFDVYLEQTFTKKGKATKSGPVRRHRINDAFDAAFPDLFNAVKTLQDMGADAVKAMGENTYDEKLADAKFDLNTGRNYFSDAAEVWSIWHSVNGVPGVRVQPHTKGDGSIDHKPFPWKLQNVKQNEKGEVIDVVDGCNVSTRDLQGYRPEVVNDMMQQKDDKGSPKWANTYQALLNSQKPRKQRGTQKGKQTTDAAARKVGNVNDWESVTSDMAVLIREPGFRAEFVKRCNDPDQTVADDFTTDNGDIWKFFDQVFGMADNTLAKRYGKLADARMAKETAEKKTAA